jgi:hypothetical protein
VDSQECLLRETCQQVCGIPARIYEQFPEVSCPIIQDKCRLESHQVLPHAVTALRVHCSSRFGFLSLSPALIGTRSWCHMWDSFVPADPALSQAPWDPELHSASGPGPPCLLWPLASVQGLFCCPLWDPVPSAPAVSSHSCPTALCRLPASCVPHTT